MATRNSGISPLVFAICSLSIILSVVAYPIYQAVTTHGYIFYTNGMDEASHLSWWYARYVVEDSGRLRESSRLVYFLHTIGLSGGYINVLFDVICSFSILLCTTRVFTRLGYSSRGARAGAILVFVTPLLFSPANPIVAGLSDLHFSPGWVEWLAMPFNPEIPLLRSPEPQFSWLILAVILAIFPLGISTPLVLLAATPLLYPFVRLPVAFIALCWMGPKRWSLCTRLLTAFVAISLGMLLFRHFAEPSLLQYFVVTRLPVISCTGIVAAATYAAIRSLIPEHMRRISLTLVASIWAVENVQIISGWFVTPVNYEQYWGVMVIGFLLALATLHSKTSPTRWVVLTVAIFVLNMCQVFRFNDLISSKLAHPGEDLARLAQSAPNMITDDIYVATFLDLVHPRQEPTAFSFTKTYQATSSENYELFQCAKQALQQQRPNDMPRFHRILERLEVGYTARGTDLNVTMGRQPLPEHPPSMQEKPLNCPESQLYIIDTK